MTSPKAAAAAAAADKPTLDEVAAQVASLASAVAGLTTTVTQLAQQVAGAVQQFQPVAQRVTELSAAFLDANTKLNEVEAQVLVLQQSMGQAPAEERLAAMEASLGELGTKVARIETTGVRRTRLQQRLASIENKLDQLLPDDESTEGTI